MVFQPRQLKSLIMTSEICNRHVSVLLRTIRFHVVSVTFHWHIKVIISDFNLRLERIRIGKRAHPIIHHNSIVNS